MWSHVAVAGAAGMLGTWRCVLRNKYAMHSAYLNRSSSPSAKLFHVVMWVWKWLWFRNINICNLADKISTEETTYCPIVPLLPSQSLASSSPYHSLSQPFIYLLFPTYWLIYLGKRVFNCWPHWRKPSVCDGHNKRPVPQHCLKDRLWQHGSLILTALSVWVCCFRCLLIFSFSLFSLSSLQPQWAEGDLQTSRLRHPITRQLHLCCQRTVSLFFVPLEMLPSRIAELCRHTLRLPDMCIRHQRTATCSHGSTFILTTTLSPCGW